MRHRNIIVTAILASTWATAACGRQESPNPVAPSAGLLPTRVISENAQCTIQASPVDAASTAKVQLAPDGVLRVGVNYGNPNNASRDGSGVLRGVAIDLACAIAAELRVDVAFSAYSGIPPLLQGFDRGEWMVGFTATAANLTTAHPHLGVENTYLVRGAAPFQSVTDVDRAGVRISVAQGNNTDMYLTANLRSATLVRFPTVTEALTAVQQGTVDAFAGGRDTALGFLPQMPEGRVLPDTLATFYLGISLGLDRSDALTYLNVFVERAKRSGLIQEAVSRAGLTGVMVPPPL
jgi:polar amino acid transport system substrate-binding protein